MARVGELADRRVTTAARIETIREKLKATERLASGKACVYATGSFGRCEASAHSDLDVFIVGKRDGRPGPEGKEGSLLKNLDEICIKADLIEVTRQLEIPEFSGDGRYLVHYSVHEFTKTLGSPEDDLTNTFTARLLLLLESRPLRSISDIISRARRIAA
jgi:predicted nucleotidyltransferase